MPISPIVDGETSSTAAATSINEAFTALDNGGLGLFKSTVLTSSGTHTYDAATKYVRVRIRGGGGAGGGAGVTLSTHAAAGAGGGQGGYCEKFFTRGAIASGTVVIGSG